MANSRTGSIEWYFPELRGIIPLDHLYVSRSLRKVIRAERFTVSYNTAFDRVITECANRPDTWISHELENFYKHLHHSGFCHSIEIWQDQQLTGGLYGVALGGAFFGESMFHIKKDTSKIALVYLVLHLLERGYTLLDTQYITPHLTSLGAIEIPYTQYLHLLRNALTEAPSFFPVQKPSGLIRAC